jgi:hypothetical protein
MLPRIIFMRKIFLSCAYYAYKRRTHISEIHQSILKGLKIIWDRKG